MSGATRAARRKRWRDFFFRDGEDRGRWCNGAILRRHGGGHEFDVCGTEDQPLGLERFAGVVARGVSHRHLRVLQDAPDPLLVRRQVFRPPQQQGAGAGAGARRTQLASRTWHEAAVGGVPAAPSDAPEASYRRRALGSSWLRPQAAARRSHGGAGGGETISSAPQSTSASSETSRRKAAGSDSTANAGADSCAAGSG